MINLRAGRFCYPLAYTGWSTRECFIYQNIFVGLNTINVCVEKGQRVNELVKFCANINLTKFKITVKFGTYVYIVAGNLVFIN